jgi:hypothetical protein
VSEGDWRDTLMFRPAGSHYDGTVISSAVTLTPVSGATKLYIQALDQNVRFTLDGTTPTSVKGFQLKAGDPLICIPLAVGTTIKVIEEAATADIQYLWGT